MGYQRQMSSMQHSEIQIPSPSYRPAARKKHVLDLMAHITDLEFTLLQWLSDDSDKMLDCDKHNQQPKIQVLGWEHRGLSPSDESHLHLESSHR